MPIACTKICFYSFDLFNDAALGRTKYIIIVHLLFHSTRSKKKRQLHKPAVQKLSKNQIKHVKNQVKINALEEKPTLCTIYNPPRRSSKSTKYYNMIRVRRRLSAKIVHRFFLFRVSQVPGAQGIMRRAPSSLMVSPFSSGFSTIAWTR